MGQALAWVQTRTAVLCSSPTTSATTPLISIYSCHPKRKSTHCVLRQAIQQLLDAVHIVILKLHPRPDNALLKCQRLLRDQELMDLLDLFTRLATVLERRLDKVRLREICVDALSGLDK